MRILAQKTHIFRLKTPKSTLISKSGATSKHPLFGAWLKLKLVRNSFLESQYHYEKLTLKLKSCSSSSTNFTFGVKITT